MFVDRFKSSYESITAWDDRGVIPLDLVQSLDVRAFGPIDYATFVSLMCGLDPNPDQTCNQQHAQ